MKRSELIKKLRNRVRVGKGVRIAKEIEKIAPTGKRYRKLLLEPFEHRILLAADLHVGSSNESVCLEWSEFSQVDSTAVDTTTINQSQDGDNAGTTNNESVVENLVDNRQGDTSGRGVDGKGTLDVALNSEAVTSSIVGSFVYYGGSAFADLGAIGAMDLGKVFAQEGLEPQTLTFENLLSNSQGINGLAFDISNLPNGTMSLDDLHFQVSPTGDFDPQLNPPAQWQTAPAADGISVTDPDENQLQLVTVQWADNAIANRWLRVTVLANSNTGLSEPEVYYIGHLQGKTHDEVGSKGRAGALTFYEVGSNDAKTVRAGVGAMSTPETVLDVNKDGVVSFRDISLVRSAYGNRLTQITIPPTEVAAGTPEPLGPDALAPKSDEQSDKSDKSQPISEQVGSPATVVGSFVYYRNSGLSSNGVPGAALDTSKQLAKESSEPKKLGVENLINSSLGINGIVFDVSELAGESLTTSDFVFQMSPTGAFNELATPAMNWELAPTPEMISVTKDLQSGISRISIDWPDNAIVNRWLRVTIMANANTGLEVPDTYYIGHLQGKSTDWMINFGGWNPSGIYEVHTVDTLAIRQEVGQIVDAGNVFDVNKDGVISFRDIFEMRNHVGTQLSNITVSGPVASSGAAQKMSGSLATGEDQKPSVVADMRGASDHDLNRAVDDKSNQEQSVVAAIDETTRSDNDRLVESKSEPPVITETAVPTIVNEFVLPVEVELIEPIQQTVLIEPEVQPVEIDALLLENADVVGSVPGLSEDMTVDESSSAKNVGEAADFTSLVDTSVAELMEEIISRLVVSVH